MGYKTSLDRFRCVRAAQSDRGLIFRRELHSFIGRSVLVVLLCGHSLLLGCLNSIPPPDTRTPFVYRVGPDDVLSVEVWNEAGLEQREVTVTPDGHISFPLVSGTLEVTDMTIGEIAEALRVALLVVVQEPLVTVTLIESRSVQVQVIGEIARQGRVPYRDGLSLVQAIGAAGGADWTTANVSSVRVVRGALSDPVLFEVDVKNLLKAGEKDIFLEPGDIVVVPAKWVTRFARYVQQLLTPVSAAAGAASTVSRVGVGGIGP